MPFSKLCPFVLAGMLLLLCSYSGKAQEPGKIQIMLVGFDHLNQLYNGTASSDVYGEKKQAEIAKLSADLMRFNPEMVMVEVSPEEQPLIDSLYVLYLSGDLHLNEMANGRGETFQVGFRLGKHLGHSRIYCIDHYEATSQSLLTSGENIAYFQNGLLELQNTARPLKKRVQSDSLSIYNYIWTMNKPEMIHMTHHLFFNLPAVVVNGTFSEKGTNTVDLGEPDPKYIGAEFISLLYNRNLKIYANILNAQLQSNKSKLLVIIGQTHVGVLQNLFEVNPRYEIVSPLDFMGIEE